MWKSRATKQMQVVQYIMEQRNLASLRVLQGEPKNLEKSWRSNQKQTFKLAAQTDWLVDLSRSF